MARRIRARTLARVLEQYLMRFPSEVVEESEEWEPAEGAELLALLASESAWLLLGRAPPAAAAGWLEQSNEAALQRLMKRASPHQLARLWPSCSAALRTRIKSGVDPKLAAGLS